MKHFRMWRLAAAVCIAGMMAGISGIAFAQYIAPTTPTGVSASANGPSRITISWSVPASAPNLAGYYVYRNGSVVANTSATSFIDTVQLGAYTYAVASYDTGGAVSPQSAATSLITMTADTTPPTTPANLAAVAATSSVVLNWGASTDNVGVVGYYLYRDGNRLGTSTITGTTYTDAPLPSGYTYTYSVEAYDAAGNISESSNPARASTINDTSPPSEPSDVTAKKVAPTEIDISWQASADNIGVTGYTILRNDTQVTTVASGTTTYDDTGLTAGATYTYQITASDLAGNISQSGVLANITTPFPDTTPPTSPSNLTPTVLSPSSVRLTWQAANDNVGVTGYDIYRDGNQVGNTSSTVFTDTGLASGTTYTYTAAAYDAAGNMSSVSFSALATTWTQAAPPLAGGTFVSGSAAAPSVSVATASSSASSSGAGVPTFTATLYLGLRSPQVQLLQAALIGQGDLVAGYATGFFGVLTQKAVQTFQCVQNIVCSGSPASTGWGLVGAKTRKALNTL